MKNTEDRYQLIGRKVREARESAGMSQKALADSIGFESATAISLIESGERRVAIEQLEIIGRTLHRDIKYFLGQETEGASLQFALSADKELTTSDKKQILSFIEFVKNNRKR